MEYAQSRLQARFGEFARESIWEQLESAPDAAAALHIAGACGLKRLAAGISPTATWHEIEIALRERWRERVDEVASWMPAKWQPALACVRELVDLPALDHLARGGNPLPWMDGDPVLQAFARAAPALRERMLRDYFGRFVGSSLEGRGRPAPQPTAGRSQVIDAWLAEWRRRWPARTDTGPLNDLVRLLDGASKQPVVVVRPTLARKLRSLFRRSVLHPVVAFIYLAFAALDMQRLRAALVQHALARQGVGPS